MKGCVVLCILMMVLATDVELDKACTPAERAAEAMRLRGQKIESFETEVVDPNVGLVDPT